MYRQYFQVARHNVAGQARCYLAGLLMKAPRKNMERMEEYVPDCEYQSQQQFLSDSPWDHQALVGRVGRDVDELLGGPQSALLIDETAVQKKGEKSVGVARQWNGRLGKIENSQVGVFAALSNGERCALVDFRLFLPECWTNDRDRCLAAKVPEEQIVFRSKAEQALDMIDGAIANGLRFGWVAFDSGYGHLPWLLRAVEGRALRFIADVHRDQAVYREDPQPHCPEAKGRRGRRPTKLRTDAQGVEIRELFDSLPARRWRKITVRHSSKGVLNVRGARERVWLWDGEEETARCWWAVCIKHASTGEVKWFLSNAAQATTLGTLVRKHAARFWIERAFQDAKTSVGMADYQARGWVAWHHHMAMVMLALLFMLKERAVHSREIDLLTCQDIVELLNVYLPRADTTPEAVLRNLELRHKKRRKAIESAYDRAGQSLASLET